MKKLKRLVLGMVGVVFWLLFHSPVPAAEKFTLCSSWIIYARDAFIVSGVERGTFKAEGVDLNFVRGHGSGDTIKRAAAGTCDVGEAGAGPLALGRSKGVKAKLLFMKSAKFQETLYYFADSGIKTLKDLEGKRITGGPKTSSDVLMWPPFARANGIDISKVNMVYMSPGAKPSSLGAGKVDAVISFHNNFPQMQKTAAQSGKKLMALLWADHGMDIYNNGLVASDENHSKKKDLIVRFLRGYYKSLLWGFRNREAAMDIFLKKHPAVDRSTALQVLDLTFFHLFDKTTETKGIGYMDQAKMAKTIQVTFEASGIKGNLAPSEIYTNEFVDGIPAALRLFFKG
jgi:NitT/TauT family transport system substrate-binding protein